MKRFLVSFVVIAIVSSSGSAKYSGGTGTTEAPYRIGDANDLLALGADTNDYDANFILIADIDLAGYDFNTAVIAPYVPDSECYWNGVPFTGVFDGNGHKIINLNIDNMSECGGYHLGMFGYLLCGEIKNISIENVNIISRQGWYIGGLAGENSDGIITNCYSSGLIYINNSPCTTSHTLGGLVGRNGGQIDYGKINECSSSVNVNGGHNTRALGGLVGGNYYGYITNSFATGNITGVSSCNSYYMDFGGLVGENGGGSIISQCWASGNISGDSDEYPRGTCCFGGLVGLNCDFSSISNCYATGSVTNGGIRGGNIGGLVGDNGEVSDSSSIINCYSTGAVIGTSDVVGYGGLVGEGNYGTVTNSFWDVDTSGLAISDGGTGKTTAEMKTRSIFTDAGWDFVDETTNGTNDIWRMCVDGVNYPRLWWQFISGDFTCSDIVDFVDFARLANWWKRTDCADNNDCDRTDMDLSGEVDIYDLKLFCENWLKESPE